MVMISKHCSLVLMFATVRSNNLTVRGHSLVRVSIWYSFLWSVVLLSCFWCFNEIFDAVEMEKTSRIFENSKSSYWLIDEMNIRKTLQASAFSFIVLNLAEKAVLHFFLIMLNYIMSALRRKQLQLLLSPQITLKKNRWNTKNISFQFHYGKKIVTKSNLQELIATGV